MVKVELDALFSLLQNGWGEYALGTLFNCPDSQAPHILGNYARTELLRLERELFKLERLYSKVIADDTDTTHREVVRDAIDDCKHRIGIVQTMVNSLPAPLPTVKQLMLHYGVE